MPASERELDNTRRAQAYREEATLRRPGPNRDALLRLADAYASTDDLDQIPTKVLSAGLIAFGSDDDYLEEHIPLYMHESPEPAPAHIRMPPKFREEAARRRPGPNRDALLRLADELEAAGEHGRLPKGVMSAGLTAYGSDEDKLDPDYRLHEAKGSEPGRMALEPILRRSATYRPAGPNRDAILRLADELEAVGDVSIVSRDTLHAGLAALGAAYDSPPAGPDAETQ